MGRLALIATFGVVGIIGAGIWLRWAVHPTLIAFKLGMIVGRLNARKETPEGRGIGLPPGDA